MPDAPLDLGAIERALDGGNMPFVRELIAELRQTRIQRDMLEKAHAANNRALDTALAERDEFIRQHRQTLEHNRHLLNDGATTPEPNKSAPERATELLRDLSSKTDFGNSAPKRVEAALTAAYHQGFKEAIEKTQPGWREINTALRMIRDAVEEIGPAGAVKSVDVGPPNYLAEAESIIGGIEALRDLAHHQGWQQAIEAAAKCIEGGRFLSENSPIHREAKSLARAIRALTPPPQETPQ